MTSIDFSRDAAQFWDKRFSQPEYVFGKEPNAYLKNQVSKYMKPGANALCVADGEGRNSVWLAKQGMTIEAFDISPVAIEKARKLAKHEQVSVVFSVASTHSWAWKPNYYDLIAAIFIQFATPNMRVDLFAQMRDSLKPGGYLILQGYTPKQLDYKTGGPPSIDHLYTTELIQDLLRGMEICDWQEYEAKIHEGEGHRGMSALMGVVARKS
jgi:2-polyprenyl-3-methyl-5-hydroxy-6-metoxy-1,4-benzoquinol methylase